MRKNRRLKVYQSHHKNYEPVPEIKLKGRWLQELGFSIGTMIEIQIIENKLLIKQIDIEE
jgi:toxic protein SymE